ncbi:squalene/phytoene synthase family protein [Metabacillus halosaccharovorans]|uniref:squalene/phytoene synthase family protein n=1 Tax=Metabacillus halosaccharovorans TaxID=930124 RepID=UPI001C1FA23E|nr:squalene/phytoene synthase family protein [Metabacillus halosaccharovorans]MBU7592371.1 phytoene/squalene synthase family protein [Metabacillus halosaccharovorans]
MNEQKVLIKEAMEVLKVTSRTFYIPIMFLKKELKDAVAVAYLAMRAIDEIEDHEEMPNDVKAYLLSEISQLLLEDNFSHQKYSALVGPNAEVLPEVTLRLADWLLLAPDGAKKNIQEATSEMAAGMAKWAKANWKIQTREDLDDYTYYVAGLVGVMLSDLWKWHDGVETDRNLAIGYGRGLQAVNILRNQDEDLDQRGVRFLPNGWTQVELMAYANENLNMANEYMKSINKRPILLFCRLPLAIAHKTLKAIKDGREKISRIEVEETVQEVQADL